MLSVEETTVKKTTLLIEGRRCIQNLTKKKKRQIVVHRKSLNVVIGGVVMRSPLKCAFLVSRMIQRLLCEIINEN